MARIGIVGGSGKLPIIFSDAARRKGEKVIGIGLKGVTDPALEGHVDKLIWIDLGAVQKTIFAVVAERVNKIALLGKLNKDLFLKNNKDLDADARTFTGRLNDMRDYSMLRKAADFLRKFGIEIIDPTPYLRDLLPEKGVITKRPPTESEAEDITYARQVAGELARLDIGQAVAVKSKAVLALEAMEGTDRVIARAGELSQKGFVVVKAARPDQDMRFDVPLVGLETIETLAASGGTALALESGRTFLIDREAIVSFADARNIAIVIF